MCNFYEGSNFNSTWSVLLDGTLFNLGFSLTWMANEPVEYGV
jgi:hypothetical protein